MNRNWMYVFMGGVLEVIWVSGLKHASNGLEWAITIVAIAASFDLLIRAAKKLPLGTVYAVFTGLGTCGTVIAEVLLFGEPFSWIKAFFILLLLSGVMGLKLITKEETKPSTSNRKKGVGN